MTDRFRWAISIILAHVMMILLDRFMRSQLL